MFGVGSHAAFVQQLVVKAANVCAPAFPTFQPSDYLTDAGKHGFAAAITSCPLPGHPQSPLTTC
jgi:hypothetical protein